MNTRIGNVLLGLISGLTLASVVGCASAPTAARPSSAHPSSQAWAYNQYRFGDGVPWIKAQVELEHRSDGHYFREVSTKSRVCWTGWIPADVQKSGDQTLIVPKPAIRGCEAERLVIRDDGTGGYIETKSGDKWVRIDKEYDLSRID